MKLEQQHIPYKLGLGGIDTKTDERVAPIGRPRELANVRSPKTGMIAKRYALQPASMNTIGSNFEIKRLIQAGNGVLALGVDTNGDRQWYGIVRASDGDPLAASLTQLGPITGSTVDRHSAPVPKAWVERAVSGSDGYAAPKSVDAAIGVSQTCYVWHNEDDEVRATIVDSETGTYKLDSESIGGSARKFVFAVPDSNSFVVVSDNNSNGLRVSLLSSSGVLASDTSLSVNANLAWDAAMIGNTLIIAYRTSAATTLTVTKFTVSSTSLGSPSSSAGLVMTVGPVKVAIATPITSSDSTVCILVNDATNGLRGLTVSVSSLTVSQALWTLDATIRSMNFLTGALYSGGSTVVAIAEIANATDYLVEVAQWRCSIGGSSTYETLAPGMYLCSKPRLSSQGGSVPPMAKFPFVVVGHLSKNGSDYGLQHARFLVEAVSTSVMARFLVGDADLPPSIATGVLSNICAAPPSTSQYGAPVTEFMCPNVAVPSYRKYESGTNKARSIVAMRYSLDPREGYAAVEDGDTLLVQAGYLALFDGRRCVENGFLLNPEIVSVTASNGSGSIPSNAAIKVVVVFFWIDAAGQIHRSAPSEVYDATTGASDDTLTVSVRLVCPTTKITFGLEVYRTEDDGTVFYLADVIEDLVQSTTPQTIELTGSDATLIESTPLGQQAGVLDNAQPSCPVTITANGRRVLVVEGTDRQSVMQSKRRVSGEGAAFIVGAGRRIAQDGPIEALTTVGERWVALQKRRPYLASGDGADDTGQSDSLSEFEGHPMSGVGCINARSVVRCSAGTIFQSPKGIYLLDSGGGIVPIGAPVDDYKDFPVISAVFHEDRNEVHFLLLDGPRLVLELHETESGVQPRWYVDEDDASAAPYGDIAVVNGLLYAATENRGDTTVRTLHVENVGGYADQASNYPVIMRVTTGWIPLEWARLYEVRFMGTVQEVHTARVRAAYDMVDAWVDDKTITSANATAGGTAPYEWAFRPTRPRARAIKLEFTETLASASRGCELNELVLTVGLLPGKKRLQSRQRAVA